MKCMIFGAGKIARGFIGHLLYLSGIEFVFVEKADALVQLINERGAYTVNILGDAEKNAYVTGAKAIAFSDEEAIRAAFLDADCVFTAVGGKNLKDIAPLLMKGIEEKAKTGKSLNIVTCENWKDPALLLRNAISETICDEAKAYFDQKVGVTEAVIMRSAIEATADLLEKDPLIVNVQSFWELPVDASRVVGTLPEIKGLKLVQEFTGFLERKFYTYNAANGTFGMMTDSGIVDPTKVTRSALQNAASVAAMILTTESLVADIPTPPAPAPAAPDMGGMY